MVEFLFSDESKSVYFISMTRSVEAVSLKHPFQWFKIANRTKQSAKDTMAPNLELETTPKATPRVNVGFYDPFSIFQGGFRTDFEKYIHIPSFYWKDNHDNLRVIKNLEFEFVEEIPHNENNVIKYLNFMFVSCQTIEDYRTKVRPLILQWLSSLRATTPKIPYFIFFFENTELKTTADKFLKTNLFNKIKLDFDNKEFNVENIFKIKSIYQTNEDKLQITKSILASTKALLAESANLQLEFYKDDLIKTAIIFQNFQQQQDALTCYSKLFNTFPFIKKEEFENLQLSQIVDVCKSPSSSSVLDTSSKFLLKCWYYRKQQLILTENNGTDIVYIKNVCRLAQTLLSFLNSLEMCYKRNEISCLMIDLFFENQTIWPLIEQHKHNSQDLINFIGNLKLLQRNELIALGISKGYYVKGSISIIDIQFKNSSYEIQNKNLESIMSSSKTFIDHIIDSTRDLINIFNDSSININKVASLSTELALILYYSTEDYETSCDQLVKSYEFFFSNGWKYIGFSLLEVYIENLDKLIDKHGESVYFQLLSSYITLAGNDIAKFNEKRFKSLCSNLPTHKILKTADLFLIEIASSVYCDEVDVYKIDVKLKSKLHYKVDKVKLIMKSKINNFAEFVCDDVDIGVTDTITLSCSELVFDEYTTTNFAVVVGNFEISQQVHSKIHITPIDSFFNLKSNTIENNATALVTIPRVRNLNSDMLIFQVIIGSNEVSDLKLIFLKEDRDKLVNDALYKMHITLNEKTDIIEFTLDETQKELSFSPKDGLVFEPGTKIRVEIPYFFPPDVTNTILNVGYVLKFKSKSKNKDSVPFVCSREYHSQVESLLPVAVAANEIFRSSYTNDKCSQDPLFSILSQFTINSISIDNPIRIQKVDLLSQNSKIDTSKSPKNVIAFMDQGSSFFYKISEFSDKDILLKIEYNSIRDEVVNYMNMAFTNFLKKKLSANLENFFTFKTTGLNVWKNMQYKYNFYALTQKIVPIDFTIDIIDGFMKYIDQRVRAEFKSLVEEFMNSLKYMTVDEAFKTELYSISKYELDITVALPVINMVNVVEYNFKKELQYLVCEPINVKVVLDVHLLKLSKHQIEEFDKASEKKVRFENKEISEFYGIDGKDTIDLDISFVDSDQKWVIAGVKNLEISVDVKETITNKGKSFEFDLNFIPLKPGRLQLPAIEIKNHRKDLIMELDYKNTADSVLIVSELNKIIHSF